MLHDLLKKLKRALSNLAATNWIPLKTKLNEKTSHKIKVLFSIAILCSQREAFAATAKSGYREFRGHCTQY